MYPFRKIVQFLRWGVVSTSSNPPARGPPFVGCPRLHIQYIRSYPAYLEAVSPSTTWGRVMPWWQGPTYHGYLYLYSFFNFGARWGGWLKSRPGRFTPRKETRYPLHRRFVGLQGGVDGCGKVASAGIRFPDLPARIDSQPCGKYVSFCT
jgi:hypothetical protein